MKRIFYMLLSFLVLISAAGCSNADREKNSVSGTQADSGEFAIQTETQTDKEQPNREQADKEQPNREQESQTLAAQINKDKEKSEMIMNIQIGSNVLTAALVKNSSTQALIEMLSEGPVTINMNDYAGMEKVGPLPKSLPRNDEHIGTDACDLILYQGNSFVIYYDTNSWSLTRLGRINNVTKQELREILGNGSITAVLSLPV